RRGPVSSIVVSAPERLSIVLASVLACQCNGQPPNRSPDSTPPVSSPPVRGAPVSSPRVRGAPTDAMPSSRNQPGADLRKMSDLAKAELAKTRAASARDLVAGGPPRALRIMTPSSLPHSGGRTYSALVALEPAPKSALGVPSEISLTFVFTLDENGGVKVVE